ncbi:Re/Si-specific NAD(P)(+) transhydrogenase subunit alpha [Leptothoe sp. PORK10 BA2]|uniref:Re/Si-specific NAD(P)(+) transhydrogenase subunit alpha n=1 Tax=Leptothoe sp. PORK10 BA2 TaxID=3110254 RepID=UPI002B1FD68A|nr:Re/Si-specific NAD(P)(+) transhydrogenase subunit alpha [Leptothoe sp. PORK10 BA2]MEA5466421.1 Re/Si-specific NAD(P)(+) transhydrogenase subunit alpha [Leptothoe sp. PORK10 BA2]
MTIALDKGAVDQQSSPPSRPKRVGIPKEIAPGECRVAATPKTVKKLQSLGFEVLIEQGAGERAEFSDQAYREADCQVVGNARELWDQADIVLKVEPPAHHPDFNCDETALGHDGQTLISFLWPAQNADLVQQLAAKQMTALAMDSVPRISRAQKMDALSSMANVAGYRAVIEAANNFGRFFTGQITAAGKVPPAKVLVIGAGVAGLAAIGAAKSLGAIVRAFDTRPVVKEQVESMGAQFLELEFEEDGSGSGGYAKTMSKEFIAAEMALFAEQAKEVDIIITTALIPGKRAPLLVTKDTVELMKPGSVVVDMAAAQGGNCEVCRPGEVYRHHGVTIVGLTDLASRMAGQSSQLYGMNLYHLLNDMGGSEGYSVNFDDEVVRGALVSHEGQVTWPAPMPEKPAPAKVESTPATTDAAAAGAPKISLPWKWIGVAFAAIALIGVGIGAPSSFLSHFTVFILACFVGWQVIWNVSPSLHTPLMSVTNAISGIIIIGGMLQISGQAMSPTVILGAVAIFIGTINIAGGFLVTQRMLKMFRK